jgi:amidase
MQGDPQMVNDPYNAFCTDAQVHVKGADAGPLAGLTFAAKDIFDVAGHVCGCGNPDWKATHPPAQRTAPLVQTLLDAGATLVGMTATVELTRGILGDNAHYGMPTNPCAPDCVPGGSSSGSVAAVAGELVDFALGSDTGGSVRAPASFCGLYGLRPTHGRLSAQGVMPQSPSADAAGWFTRDIDLFARVGEVLLQHQVKPNRPRRVVIAEDAFEVADAAVAHALEPAIDRVTSLVGKSVNLRLAPTSLHAWLDDYAVRHNYEAWHSVGDWIESTNPRIGWPIAERYTRARAITPDAVEAARPGIAAMNTRMNEVLADDTVVCLPTTPTVPPPRDTPFDRQALLMRMLLLMQISSATGTPQLTLPVAQVDGLPVGLSLLGPRNSDEILIALAQEMITCS